MIISQIPPALRDHARALLLSSGFDPSPSNLSKISASTGNTLGIVFHLERKDFLVFTEGEIISFLIEVLLANPLSLPSKYLALIISSSVSRDIDFSHCIQIAEALKRNSTPDDVWTVRAFIERDNFLEAHLAEMLVQEYGSLGDGVIALSDVFGFEAKRSIFRDTTYWVLGKEPVIEGICEKVRV